MRIITGIDQRSPEWNALRRGRITMSNAQALITGGQGVTRANYIRDVAAGLLADPDEDRYVSRDMVRGIELEDFAFRAVEAHLNEKIERVSFVIADDERIGCSPDGLSDNFGLEIKCPSPVNHLRNADEAQARKEYGAQYQGCMWVCGKESWILASFCPQVSAMPLIVHVFDRDDEMTKRISESAIRAAGEVDAIVKRTPELYRPCDAVTQIAKDALTYWNALNSAMNDEVRLYE